MSLGLSPFMLVGPASLAAGFHQGVVVETVSRQGAGTGAGVRPGDTFLQWSCSGTTGALDTPFDFRTIETEALACGAATAVRGLRGMEQRVWRLPRIEWGISVRPTFDDRIRTDYFEGRKLAEQGNLGGAARVWEALVDQNLGLSLQTWLLFRTADLYANDRQWDRADVYYQRAVELASRTKPAILAQVLKAWGETFWRA